MATVKTTKIFRSGNSQAVRLPKEFQFDVGEVEIFHRGDEVVLRKPRLNLSRAYDALASVEGMVVREQPVMQERDFGLLDRGK
jgi:antitoxin VapB